MYYSEDGCVPGIYQLSLLLFFKKVVERMGKERDLCSEFRTVTLGTGTWYTAKYAVVVISFVMMRTAGTHNFGFDVRRCCLRAASTCSSLRIMCLMLNDYG